MATCVIVDGNNLAHYLFSLGSGKQVSLVKDAQLVTLLGAWADSQNTKVEVELCLDPRREKVAGNHWVTVFTADHGREADGMIVGKVRHRVYAGDPCIVVTSDEELKARVAEYQVRCITVFDFVIARTPPEFAPLPARIAKGQLPFGVFPDGQAAQLPTFKARRPAKRRLVGESRDEQGRILDRTLADRNAVDEFGSGHPPADHHGAGSGQTPEAAASKPQLVRLQFEHWPLQAGVKFLRESFCAAHFGEVASLFSGGGALAQADIPVLAEFLITHCAGEDDFISRGGSLMDRVRLALLRAPGFQLPVSCLADQTGDSLANIKHKLRQHDGSWVTFE